MRVGVLNDEAQDLFRRLHGDVETHRRAEIMKVDVARPDREPVQQLRDGLTEGGKRGGRQDVGLAKARQIGRDHVGGLRQLGHDLPKHSRGARKAVQEQHGGLGRLTCRDEGQLRAAGQAKSLPGRWAHVRTPLLDRLIARNVCAEAPTGSAATSQMTLDRVENRWPETTVTVHSLTAPGTVRHGSQGCEVHEASWRLDGVPAPC